MTQYRHKRLLFASILRDAAEIGAAIMARIWKDIVE